MSPGHSCLYVFFNHSACRLHWKVSRIFFKRYVIHCDMFNHDQFWWDLLSTFVKSRVRPSQHSDGMFELSIAIHNLFKLIYCSLEFIIYSLIYSYLFIIYQESGLKHYPFQKWPSILLPNTLNKKRCRSARRDGKRGHLLRGRESEWRCRSWDNDRRGCHAQPGIKKRQGMTSMACNVGTYMYIPMCAESHPFNII